MPCNLCFKSLNGTFGISDLGFKVPKSQLYTKLCHGHIYVCFKQSLVQLFPVRSLPNLQVQKWFITPFACHHLHFCCQCCQLSGLLGQSEKSDNRHLWPLDDRLMTFGLLYYEIKKISKVWLVQTKWHSSKIKVTCWNKRWVGEIQYNFRLYHIMETHTIVLILSDILA